MMEQEEEKMKTVTFKREYIPPKLETIYIEMEEGIANGSKVQINPGGGGIKSEDWIDGGNAGTGEPENEWWN
ncbi:hypothetical protein HZP98_00570 [Elizabethkingia anophelis]|uniref:Uncharacterized protein n=1 Tax=Elizabethkingia anophelis TaxID=1117645 RepID=A0AAE4P1T4_9FLAO|nr:hypothetical protein [Elizabethkingia anophelis]MCT3918322.1 hypothetical protein [Elizabethkingia anophelis]MCT3950515.1 hypothetical protein [Elizabethkingia anophelis]MCT3954058.1 hypothetical protein [Elizabethkingia anophelis]MCT3986001.1 hypothetical protein [Elizabethkingia anophelis]